MTADELQRIADASIAFRAPDSEKPHPAARWHAVFGWMVPAKALTQAYVDAARIADQISAAPTNTEWDGGFACARFRIASALRDKVREIA